MNFLHKTWSKKISAVALLLLFLFIHAVKIFHTHEFSFSAQTENAGKNGASINANLFCAICDFQIAKDSDAEIFTLHISSPVKTVNHYYHYITHRVISFSLHSSVRGPPYSYC